VIARCDASNAVKKRVLLASKAQLGGRRVAGPVADTKICRMRVASRGKWEIGDYFYT